MTGGYVNVHHILHGRCVDEHIQQQDLYDDCKHTHQICDSMLEEGDSPCSTHVQMEYLRHDQSNLPGSRCLSSYIHLLFGIKD